MRSVAYFNSFVAPSESSTLTNTLAPKSRCFELHCHQNPDYWTKFWSKTAVAWQPESCYANFSLSETRYLPPSRAAWAVVILAQRETWWNSCYEDFMQQTTAFRCLSHLQGNYTIEVNNAPLRQRDHNLGCLLLSSSVPFVFKIYRLLFPTLLDFVPNWTAFCSRGLLPAVEQWNVQLSRAECSDFSRHVFCFTRFGWRVLLSCRLTRLNFNSVRLCFGMSVRLFYQTGFLCQRPTFCFLSDRSQTTWDNRTCSSVRRPRTASLLFRKFLMTCSIVLQINLAGFE